LIEQGRLSTACRRGRHSLQAGETLPFADPPGGRALDLVDRDAVVAGVGHEQPSGLAEPGIVRMGHNPPAANSGAARFAVPAKNRRRDRVQCIHLASSSRHGEFRVRPNPDR